jgi:hypothetical protein
MVQAARVGIELIMSSLHPESARKGDHRGLIERRFHVVTIKKMLHELLEFFFLVFFLLIQFLLLFLLLRSLSRFLLELRDILAFDSASVMSLHSHLTSLLITDVPAAMGARHHRGRCRRC